MTLSVKSQIIRDPDGRIKVWKPTPQARNHYHIGIWIDGDVAELNSITRVEYELDASFTTNHRSSKSRKNNFSITIWTWGYFPIVVTIYKSESKQEIHYNLSYRLPADNGNNYVSVE